MSRDYLYVLLFTASFTNSSAGQDDMHFFESLDTIFVQESFNLQILSSNSIKELSQVATQEILLFNF